MGGVIPMHVQQHIERPYQQQSRRVISTLIRLLGDFALAEEAMQEAFAAAVQRYGVALVEGGSEGQCGWLKDS